MKRALKWLFIGVFLAISVAVIMFWTPDTDAAAMRAKYGGPSSQFLKLNDGLTVHLRDEGPRDAPVIVLLHGSNASLHIWDAWTKQLVPAYRVIRFDLPGHGLTGAFPARDYSQTAFADIVDRVTTKLGVAQFALAGNSMGGGVAWVFAHKHPEKLTGLVLIDASGEPEPRQSSLPLGFRLARTPGLRDLMTVITPRSLVEEGFRHSVSKSSVVTPAAIDLYWELLRYPGNRRATIDRFSTPREAPLTGDVSVPTLILWGAEDKLIPASSVAWFQKQVPSAHAIVYPGVGHLPMEEIPQQSMTDLKAWLATLPHVKAKQ